MLTREWEGPLPSIEELDYAAQVAKAAAFPATENDRMTHSRKLLNMFASQTSRWTPAQFGEQVAIYAEAMEDGYLFALQEVTHPRTTPFKFLPHAPEVAKAVENAAARIGAIEWRVKTARAAIKERGERKPISAEDRRRRAQALTEASKGMAKRSNEATKSARPRDPSPKHQARIDAQLAEERAKTLKRFGGEDT